MFKPDYQKMFQILQSPTISKENNVLLEPLSCIFRMCLLNYKGDGMKISILNNSIQYNENNYYQGLWRSYNGDTREDLHNLYNPFLKSFEWYPIEEENGDNMYQYFYQKCHDGIHKLLNSYDKSSIIHHTLTHYCKIFNDCIQGKIIEKDEKQKESPLLNELRNLWKNEELSIIYQTLQFLDNCEDEDEKTIYFQTIDSIVTMKEKKVYDYVRKASTTYN